MAKYILLADRLNTIKENIKKTEAIFLFLDYDGTLAPFHEDPDKAGPLPGIEKILKKLAAINRIFITIISGRERTNLQRQINLPGIELSGLHGLQSPAISTPINKYNEREMSEIVDSLNQTIDDKDLKIENKKFGLTIHHSPRTEKSRLLKKIKKIIDEEKYQVIPGRLNIEIRPSLWDKGKAAAKYEKFYRKMAGTDNYLTIYIGDDRTDEDAFHYFQQGITIYVVNEDNKNTSARYYLNNPAEVKTFLEFLLKQKT